MAADVTDKHEMEFIARDADVIFSCTDAPYQNWKNFYPAIANALAYALSRTNAKLVFADNLYSYGNVSGTPMNETMPHKAKTRKGMIRASVINSLLLSGDTFNKRVVFVKAADFIGPAIHKGIFGIDFLKRLYNGESIFLFGNTRLEHSFTNIYDFAVAMMRINDAADTFGQLWHVPNAPAISIEKWIRLFENETGKKAKIKLLPKLIIRLAGLFNSSVKELYELAYQFEFHYLIDDMKYSRRFGNHSASHSTIVRETVAWYIQNIRQQEIL